MVRLPSSGPREDLQCDAIGHLLTHKEQARQRVHCTIGSFSSKLLGPALLAPIPIPKTLPQPEAHLRILAALLQKEPLPSQAHGLSSPPLSLSSVSPPLSPPLSPVLPSLICSPAPLP